MTECSASDSECDMTLWSSLLPLHKRGQKIKNPQLLGKTQKNRKGKFKLPQTLYEAAGKRPAKVSWSPNVQVPLKHNFAVQDVCGARQALCQNIGNHKLSANRRAEELSWHLEAPIQNKIPADINMTSHRSTYDTLDFQTWWCKPNYPHTYKWFNLWNKVVTQDFR